MNDTGGVLVDDREWRSIEALLESLSADAKLLAEGLTAVAGLPAGSVGEEAADLSPEPVDPWLKPSSPVPADGGPPPYVISAVSYVSRAALVMVAAITLGMAGFLAFVSGIEHEVQQTRQYNRFRDELAAGTAPIAQTNRSGGLLTLGTPVALIQIPAIHMHEVVGEGTTAEVLTKGPGHLRDTSLPGQPGTSVIFGRQAAYGGPFKRIHDLRPGDVIYVTVGFGSNQEKFRVIDVRRPGNPAPPTLAVGASRLTLVTADGVPFMPGGLIYVDANLAGSSQPASPMVLTSSTQLLPSEHAGANDTSTLWALVLWLQGLLVATAAAVWCWYRWGRIQTWTVFLPVLLLLGLGAADQVTRLLPNLL